MTTTLLALCLGKKEKAWGLASSSGAALNGLRPLTRYLLPEGFTAPHGSYGEPSL